MLQRMVTINLLYNNWFTLFILFAVIVLVYVLVKRYLNKKDPQIETEKELMNLVNRELIKLDSNVEQLKEEVKRKL